jgi:uncharacterized repeat protein (TIGR01451 family)
MKYIFTTIVHIFLSFVIIFSLVATGYTAETDDSTIFVEAFNAYQQKDYLLVIEKCDQLNQVFPDSPLRDVTLLLIARASLKSGDNDRAAKSTALFSSEFPESSLKTSVEDELKVLASRLQKGEVLPVNKSLQNVSLKVKNERLARESEAALKLERERITREKAEQERLTRIKQEEDRREQERLLAEKLAKESINVAIAPLEGAGPIPVGSNGSIPIEFSNKGNNSEEFLITISLPKEYGAILVGTNKNNANMTRLQLAAGETFKGTVELKMPAGMVDGHRCVMTIKAVSAKFSDVSFVKETVVVSSAPLIRAVAKLSQQKVTPGEKLRYRIAVLNAGSLPAQDLNVRVMLPPQIDFQGASDVVFQQESERVLVFKINQVDIGKLVEFQLDVKVREDSALGKEFRCHLEVDNAKLQTKEIFKASSSVVVVKAK